MTIAEFCSQYGLVAEDILHSLAEENILARQEMTIKAVVRENKTSPVDIYALIRTVSSGASIE